MELAAQQLAEPSLKGTLVWSALFHAALAGGILASAFMSNRGNNWGEVGGGSVEVGIVGAMPGVPLPKPAAITESRVVDESGGLYKSEPKPKEVPPPPDAKSLPEFDRDKKQPVQSHKSKVLEDKTPPPSNAVPYGGGGSPALPYSPFTVKGSTQGGMGFTGPGGDFGSRYPWFVDAVRNRISSNWLQSMVDPSVSWAPRAVVTFQILRDGSIANIQITQSSGNASVDNSAVRAILGSSPVNRLPNDYSGSTVNVEFWFEFRR
ncbi:MAG TPA: energy transducer TonB [Candidatus Acidoferrales bacterium]|nr:energy transducer TonB [Candidatus Acidoferrales bacterium]